jgi:hypothetical protein
MAKSAPGSFSHHVSTRSSVAAGGKTLATSWKVNMGKLLKIWGDDFIIRECEPRVA